MFRLLTAALTATTLLTLPALASGDRASLNVIGFSADGRYFAFEEAGENFGTGGIYDHIFVVDLSTDSWVNKTSFAIDIANNDDPKTPSIVDIHDQVMSQAAPLLKRLGIGGTPTDTMALLTDGTPNDDGKSMTIYDPRVYGINEVDTAHAWTIKMTTAEAKTAADCSATTLGFALTFSWWDKGSPQVVHDDTGTTIPTSRGCPADYRLYGVFRPGIFDNAPWVAIVSVYSKDPDGNYDRRFMAVPLDTYRSIEG